MCIRDRLEINASNKFWILFRHREIWQSLLILKSNKVIIYFMEGIRNKYGDAEILEKTKDIFLILKNLVAIDSFLAYHQ